MSTIPTIKPTPVKLNYALKTPETIHYDNKDLFASTNTKLRTKRQKYISLCYCVYRQVCKEMVVNPA